MNNIELSYSVHSSNIKSIISIYNDSIITRQKRQSELEEKLRQKKEWSEKDFNDFTHYTHHFDWLLIQALFISGFSYFENFMRNVAKDVENNKCNKIKIKDLRGDGTLDCYRKYIYFIGEVENANCDKKEWQEITEFKKIRNSITHEYGQISVDLIKANEHDIYFGPGKHMIRIKNINFLEDFVNIAIRYMELIVNELNNKNFGS